MAAVLLLAAIVFAGVGTAEASEKTALQLAWRHLFQFSGYYAALFVIVMLAIGAGFLVVINRKLRSEVQERKQVEKALKESEERFNLAMDASKDGVYEWDLETREVYYSPGWKRMLGYEPDELPDDFSIWETLTRPEDVEKSWQIMKDVVEQKRERFEVEFEMRHKDGHWIHVLSRANIYKDANGKPVRVVGTHVDITESKNQRERLRLSESRYRKAQKLAKVGNWEYDLNTKQFWGSDEAKKIYGFDPEQDSFTTGEVESCIIERERVHQALVDLIEKGKPYNLAFDIVTKNTGRIKTIVSIAEIETDGADNPVKISGVIHDITERRQAEQALIEKEALFRGLFDHMTSGSAVYEVRNDGSKGTDYIIREFNRKSLELEGKNLDEVLGKSLFDLRPNIDDYGLIPVMKKVWDTGIPDFFPSRIYQDDTFSNYYENHIFKLPSGEVVTIYNDVTDQKNQEKDLRESEKKYRVLFDTVPLGITVSDQFGNIVESNAVYEKFLGTPETEPGTRTVDEPQWQIIRPDGTPMPAAEYAGVRALKEKRPIENVEMGIVKSDTEITWMNVSAAPLHLQKYGAVVTYGDITERKRTEAEKEKLQTQLLQAQKMESVGRLAGGVAHDFNNMLGVILGHAELALLQADETHDLHADLLEIQKAAKRSADITKQLLAFARKQTISPRKLDLNDTVESALKMLRRLIGEDIDLKWQAAAHIWPVKMDPSQIDQILANLCINARDAISGVGKITIETGINTFDDEYCNDHPGFIPGDFVLLAVSDNGCGMDKDTLDNLFEPFFTTKEVGKGTGLGLATVYGIVKQNNGFINVYSEPGQGAIFKIYLPRFLTDEETETAVSGKKSAAGGTETILLVEDEPSILRMTQMMLERKGYTVLSAATPAEAMEKAKNWSGAIDLLITDVVMPEMNGQDLAKKITDLYQDILCLYMSGYTAEIIANHGVLDAGVAFIQKPFSMAAMTEKVRVVLDNAPEDR
jgi:PAS domain S-box-containing protein